MAEAQLAPENDLPRRWGLGDAFLIAAMFAVSQVLGLLAAGGIVRSLHADPLYARHPFVLLAVEFLGYVFAFLCARVIIMLKTGASFRQSIEWSYPGGERLPQLLLLGLLLAVIVGFTLPMFPAPPKKMPIEHYFSGRLTSIVSMLFATLFAPVAEEIYFRGILYPALRWSLEEERPRHGLAIALVVIAVLLGAFAYLGWGGGFAMFAIFLAVVGLMLLRLDVAGAPLIDEERATLLAIVLTAVFFGFVHGAQLSYAWGPLLLITFVGVVLTAVRVRLQSVAASWIVHLGYNGTWFLLMWSASAGFTKLSG